jgi:hypothetical protein|tara:strand:- start:453 stop:1136 length:684 start_codon:yes stop_codon:yes gene_type:complete
MPTPSSRTPVRVARGTYSNLNSSVSDIQEGEICYATDQNKLYVKEGSSLESTQADVAAKANIASPTFTGTPAGPTASVGTNTTQLATTAYVQAEVGQSIQAHDADTAKTDVAQTFTKAQRGSVVTLTSASSITIDFSLGNNFILTTGHGTIAFANPTTEVAGQSGSIFIVQGSTTCAAPSWGNQYLFPGGTPPSLTGTTGKIARIDYVVQEAGKIHCVTTDNLVATS